MYTYYGKGARKGMHSPSLYYYCNCLISSRFTFPAYSVFSRSFSGSSLVQCVFDLLDRVRNADDLLSNLSRDLDIKLFLDTRDDLENIQESAPRSSTKVVSMVISSGSMFITSAMMFCNFSNSITLFPLLTFLSYFVTARSPDRLLTEFPVPGCPDIPLIFR